jgi:hypothetical protein
LDAKGCLKSQLKSRENKISHNEPTKGKATGKQTEQTAVDSAVDSRQMPLSTGLSTDRLHKPKQKVKNPKPPGKK